MFSLQQGNRVDELEINHEAAYLNTQAGQAFLFCPRATQERVWDTRMQRCVWLEHPRRPHLMQNIQPGPGDVWVIPQSSGAAPVSVMVVVILAHIPRKGPSTVWPAQLTTKCKFQWIWKVWRQKYKGAGPCEAFPEQIPPQVLCLHLVCTTLAKELI